MKRSAAKPMAQSLLLFPKKKRVAMCLRRMTINVVLTAPKGITVQVTAIARNPSRVKKQYMLVFTLSICLA